MRLGWQMAFWSLGKVSPSVSGLELLRIPPRLCSLLAVPLSLPLHSQGFSSWLLLSGKGTFLPSIVAFTEPRVQQPGQCTGVFGDLQPCCVELWCLLKIHRTFSVYRVTVNRRGHQNTLLHIFLIWDAYRMAPQRPWRSGCHSWDHC